MYFWRRVDSLKTQSNFRILLICNPPKDFIKVELINKSAFIKSSYKDGLFFVGVSCEIAN